MATRLSTRRDPAAVVLTLGIIFVAHRLDDHLSVRRKRTSPNVRVEPLRGNPAASLLDDGGQPLSEGTNSVRIVSSSDMMSEHWLAYPAVSRFLGDLFSEWRERSTRSAVLKRLKDTSFEELLATTTERLTVGVIWPHHGFEPLQTATEEFIREVERRSHGRIVSRDLSETYGERPRPANPNVLLWPAERVGRRIGDYRDVQQLREKIVESLSKPRLLFVVIGEPGATKLLSRFSFPFRAWVNSEEPLSDVDGVIVTRSTILDKDRLDWLVDAIGHGVPSIVFSAPPESSPSSSVNRPWLNCLSRLGISFEEVPSPRTDPLPGGVALYTPPGENYSKLVCLPGCVGLGIESGDSAGEVSLHVLARCQCKSGLPKGPYSGDFERDIARCMCVSGPAVIVDVVGESADLARILSADE